VRYYNVAFLCIDSRLLGNISLGSETANGIRTSRPGDWIGSGKYQIHSAGWGGTRDSRRFSLHLIYQLEVASIIIQANSDTG